MDETADVRLSVTEGPVIIRGLDGAGVNATHALWDGIVASERFPPEPPDAVASGANYVLTLKKGVDHWNDVRRAEAELTKASLMLAAAWPFAGGSYMTLSTREVIYSPRFESNAAEVERIILERCGIAGVTTVTSAPTSWSATYSQPPLCLAARIAQLMHSDFRTQRLLFYHQGAVIERGHSSWFISLYKVRDFLCKLYGEREQATKKALNITSVDWKYFGRILNNNDLRHAEISGNVPSISNNEIDKLYRLARCWVASYLRIEKSLPALG
jgi:hypothetical protein